MRTREVRLVCEREARQAKAKVTRAEAEAKAQGKARRGDARQGLKELLQWCRCPVVCTYQVPWKFGWRGER